MLRTAKTGLVALALSASALTLTATPAHAAKEYANCTALHKAFKYGVAKNKKAANKQVNSGHYRPKVAPKVYWANKKSDADKDGTACEVTS